MNDREESGGWYREGVIDERVGLDFIKNDKMH